MTMAPLDLEVRFATLPRATTALDRLSASAQRVSRSVSGLKAAVGGLGPTIAGIFGAMALGKVVNAAAALDSLQAGFKTLSGSAQGSEREMRYLMETTDRLGLQFESAAKAYLSLAAAAKNTRLEGEPARKVFESVSAAMGALGKSAADTEGALLAVQQMISKGKVSSEELRQQLGERLPGAFQMAARAMGMTTAELDKALQKGKVLADDFLPKLAAELNKTFDSSKRVNTLQAGLNRVQNQITYFFQDVGKMFSNSLRDGVTLIEDSIKNVRAVITRLYAVRDLIQSSTVGKALGPQSTSAAGEQFYQATGLGKGEFAKQEANRWIRYATVIKEKFVQVWNDFGNTVGYAVKVGVEFGLRAIQEMINLVIDKINQINGLFNMMSDTVGGPQIGEIGKATFADDYSAGIQAAKEAGEKTAEAFRTRVDEIMNTDYVGTWWGQVEQRATEIEERTKRLRTRGGGGQGGMMSWADPAAKAASGASGAAKTKLNEYQKEIEQIRDQTEALKQEAATVGMTAEASARYTATKRLEYAAREAGVRISPTIRAQIAAEANAYALAAAKVDEAKRAIERLDEARGLASGTLSSLKEDLMAGTGWAQSFANALDRLGDKLFEIAENKIWEVLLGRTGTTGTGLLGSLFSNALGGGTGVGAAYPVGMPVGGVATGGHIRGRGGPTSDSIAARLSNGEFVVNAAATKKHLGLLHSINARKFSRGGSVGRSSSANARMPVGDVTVNIHGVPGNVGVKSQKTTQRPDGGLNVDVMLRQIVRDEMTRDLESNGPITRKMARHTSGRWTG